MSEPAVDSVHPFPIVLSGFRSFPPLGEHVNALLVWPHFPPLPGP